MDSNSDSNHDNKLLMAIVIRMVIAIVITMAIATIITIAMAMTMVMEGGSGFL